MLTREQVLFALNINQLKAKDQDIFFKALEDQLTPDEIKAIQIVVAYLGMKDNPAKEKAIKAAMASQLYQHFNNKEA